MHGSPQGTLRTYWSPGEHPGLEIVHRAPWFFARWPVDEDGAYWENGSGKSEAYLVHESHVMYMKRGT